MAEAVVEVIDMARFHDQFLAANLILDPWRDDERDVQAVGSPEGRRPEVASCRCDCTPGNIIITKLTGK